VDNYSTDNTRDIAKNKGAITVLKKGNVSIARNTGLLHSNGKYVLMLDSDQILSNGLIEDCLILFKEYSYDSLILPEESVGYNYWSKCFQFEKMLKKILPGKELPRFFRRLILDDVHGFDSNLIFGEDLDLFLRLLKAGYTVGKSTRIIYHYEDSSLAAITRKYVRFGFNVKQLLYKHPQNKLFFQYTLLLRNPKVFLIHFLKDPLHGLGFVFLRLLRGICIIIGALNTVIV